MKQNKKILFIAAAATLIVTIAVITLTTGTESGNSKTIRRGNLVAAINGRGEVQGEKSVRIELPEAVQDNQFRVWGYKITDIIQEGKKVKKGDFIVQLDPSELMNNMREQMTRKEKVDADLKNAVIDSTVTLTAKREDILNAKLELQYKQIDLDMSQFESGAEQRKAMMAYQKAQIQLDKSKRDYLLAQNRLKIRISRYESNAYQLQQLINRFQQALAAMRISSPGEGIVMIGEDFMGKKLSKDSRISTWMPLLATLPDMSSAIVETYIKEIEITKINLGDSASIVVDAIPNKTFTGKVIKIANMGEEKSGFDMKVFRVIIRFDHVDGDLKPGMTCNNDIIFANYGNQLLAPLKAIFSKGDNRYVYLKRSGEVVEQAVELGAEDDQNVVVIKGLSEGDRVLLYQPDSTEIKS
ncbi:efflux RND transporter periplasmic adaptor subunit [Mangrovibacterium lignilyticum]|uniref:efflux RND transporter periplasmic adaptor subunit n=1 Tax=Mangrovibacterium lignilyticum TaxID=2668052 RepID=UPI0013D51FD9|nr:efflux RND transporter periplasmic adaptor subunit [Mangrovibacterium lignilyticum]